ncbi:DgyrCDS3696 [Dimorphilus gyrociliatus]|uniref:DgyrCDS3696 n=1 Tax=Dimorphilus gyrociliatus TaxID=2664684 RepID=A0A7I8VG19_9ANNE|nr:DgyrCDS3696 [Dimorphilus gyrociliatus]
MKILSRYFYYSLFLAVQGPPINCGTIPSKFGLAASKYSHQENTDVYFINLEAKTYKTIISIDKRIYHINYNPNDEHIYIYISSQLYKFPLADAIDNTITGNWNNYIIPTSTSEYIYYLAQFIDIYGNVIWSGEDSSNSKIAVSSLDGNHKSVVVTGERPLSLAVNPFNGKLYYYFEDGANPTHELIRRDQSGNNRELIMNGVHISFSMDYSTGTLWVTNNENKVFTIDSSDNLQEIGENSKIRGKLAGIGQDKTKIYFSDIFDPNIYSILKNDVSVSEKVVSLSKSIGTLTIYDSETQPLQASPQPPCYNQNPGKCSNGICVPTSSSTSTCLCDIGETCSSATNDPHILVHVEGISLPLCFDIEGKDGDVISLFQHQSSRSELRAQLRGDQYFKTFYFTTEGNQLFFTTTKVIINGEVVSKWPTTRPKHINLPKLQIKSLGTTKFDIEHSKWTIRIEYVQKFLPYLNIYLIKLNEDGNIFEGMIGSIYSQNFTLSLNPQTNSRSIITAKHKVLPLDYRHIQAVKSIKSDIECWMTSSKDEGLYVQPSIEYLLPCMTC